MQVVTVTLWRRVTSKSCEIIAKSREVTTKSSKVTLKSGQGEQEGTERAREVRLKLVSGCLVEVGASMNLAIVALAVSIILLLSGSMVLCHCPWWYAIAALFAALAMPGGTWKVRVVAAIVFLAAIGMATVEQLEVTKQKAAVGRAMSTGARGSE